MRVKGIVRNEAFISGMFFALGFLAFFLISTNVYAELSIVKNEPLLTTDNFNKTFTNTTIGNNTSNKNIISQENFALLNQPKEKDTSLIPNNISNAFNNKTTPKEIDTTQVEDVTSKSNLTHEAINSKIEIPIVSYIENEG
ncbi:MAG: hypothetical protein AB7F53_08135, partial [Nitrososphaeraceae archaeon]